MSNEDRFAKHAAITALLKELRSKGASDHELFLALQKEIREIAQARMRGEVSGHTLQTTALVNEAFVKVFKADPSSDFWSDSSKALVAIARVMKEILIDHARKRDTEKRGGGNLVRVPLDENQAKDFACDSNAPFAPDRGLLVAPEMSETVLAVRESLEMLGQVAPRQAEIMWLQFFADLTQKEVAAALNISVELVKLETRKAKAFLKARIASF
jgi:RNA polymerase sigma factor (TIGR02999 family)